MSDAVHAVVCDVCAYAYLVLERDFNTPCTATRQVCPDRAVDSAAVMLGGPAASTIEWACTGTLRLHDEMDRLCQAAVRLGGYRARYDFIVQYNNEVWQPAKSK